jgi:hypothetical protein
VPPVEEGRVAQVPAALDDGGEGLLEGGCVSRREVGKLGGRGTLDGSIVGHLPEEGANGGAEEGMVHGE